ncbi:hypothetical protein P879_07081 [Paragonimus westermani]|uniref:Sema domain-containing protein n=1 Tax=Paragonimus westermani TaxID=34504 RepID=A0A8T0DHF9_9TREM|nr:hypothetical protein P879_07081 [Paragonimus westermani]
MFFSLFQIIEPATVLLTFETENEVYFVLREQPTTITTSCRTRLNTPPTASKPRMKSTFDGSLTDVARLVRICKGDRGGLPHVNEEKFGTFAKADFECLAGDQDGHLYAYTHIVAAHWDNETQRLYTVFTTESWAPLGSALCVFSKQDIMATFSGPLMRTNSIRFSRVPTPVPNSFSNICERFNSNNLTNEELSIGRHLSLSFPYRYNPIEPLYRRALFTQTGTEWIHLQAYNLPALPTHYHFGNPAKTTIIWLGSKTELTRVVIYELVESSPHENNQRSSHPVVCKLNEYRVGRALNVLNRPVKFRENQSDNFVNNAIRDRKSTGYKNLRIMRSFARRYNKYGSDAEQKEEIRLIKIIAGKLFVITNQQILWLPISDCSQYRLFETCQESNDPHCGWSWPEGICVDGYDQKPSLQTNWFNTFSPSVDRRSSGNVQCPSGVVLVDQRESHAWSAWYGCRLMDTGTGQTRPKWTNSNIPVNNFMRFTGICQCRVCLSRTECILGTQEVTNCSFHDRNWQEWSTWSRCDFATGVQSRQRVCTPNLVCIGSSREQRLCSSAAFWSTRQDSDVISAEVKKVSRAQVAYMSETHRFSITFVLLVGFLCLFVGLLVPTAIFYFFRSSSSCTKRSLGHSPNFNTLSNSRYCSHDSETNKSMTTKPNLDESHVTTKERTLERNVTGQQRQLIFKCPHDNLSGRHLSKKKMDRLLSHAFRSDLTFSSSQQLLSNTPHHSPMSGPSTASTLLKDRFTFEDIPDPSYDVQGESNTLIQGIRDSTLSPPYITSIQETPLPSKKVSNSDGMLRTSTEYSGETLNATNGPYNTQYANRNVDCLPSKPKGQTTTENHSSGNLSLDSTKVI